MKDPKELLSKPWQKFFCEMQEFRNLPLESWKPIHLLGYFDFRYQEHYQTPFSYSLQNSPSKCLEMVVIKKLFTKVNSTKNAVVKDYLDWIFEQKIKPKNYQMKKISFLLSPDFGAEFANWQRKNLTLTDVTAPKKLTSQTKLPTEIDPIIQKYPVDFPLQTCGDLAMFYQATQSEPSYFPFAADLFSELRLAGLDIDAVCNL